MLSVFSRNDRESNYDLLSHLYDYLSTHRAPLKEELIEDLTDYIRDREYANLDDDDGNDIADRSAKEKANLKYRQFKKCGWLEEDTTAGFSMSVSLADNALILLDAFRKIIEKESRPLEYTGFFYTIHAILRDFDYSKTKALLEQVFKNAKELFDSLQGLNSSIKHFIEELLSKEDITPEDVLEELLYKYQDQVIMAVFNNLKGRDNPSWFTSDILDKLKHLRYESLERVVDSFVRSAHPSGFRNEEYGAIEKYVVEQLDWTIARFENVDELVSIIDRRNVKFHDTALAKIRFLMNSRRDIDGLLDQALKALAQAKPDADFEDIIAIESSKTLEEKSLYSKSFNKEKPAKLRASIPQASEEEIEQMTKHLFEEDEFSRRRVDEYAMRLLEGNVKLRSEDIEATSLDDIIMLLLLQLYAEYQDVHYSVELRDTDYSVFGYRLRGFTLCRRRQE